MDVASITLERGLLAQADNEPMSEHLFRCNHVTPEHWHLAESGWAEYKDRSHVGAAPRLRKRADAIRTNTFGPVPGVLVPRADELAALSGVVPGSTKIRVRFPSADLSQ